MSKPSHPVLDSLKEDIAFYNDAIKEVAYEILDKGHSEYPIFIAHEFEVNIGEVILDKDDYDRKWTINASILEELTEMGVIQKNRVEDFKKVYKNPRENMCIFLISEKGGNFIFMPYKTDLKDNISLN